MSLEALPGIPTFNTINPERGIVESRYNPETRHSYILRKLTDESGKIVRRAIWSPSNGGITLTDYTGDRIINLNIAYLCEGEVGRYVGKYLAGHGNDLGEYRILDVQGFRREVIDYVNFGFEPYTILNYPDQAWSLVYPIAPIGRRRI